MIALQSDYGTAPGSCHGTTIAGTHFTGSTVNPPSLTGTYCNAFLANIRLQGAGQLSSGQYVQYRSGSGTYVQVSAVYGSDGTPVVAGQTVARDKTIIPSKGVLVDVDQIGNGLLANDTGGAITGYRLDLFNGAGVAACASFANPISVTACETAQLACPTSALQ